jgi:hypothetical protein
MIFYVPQKGKNYTQQETSRTYSPLTVLSTAGTSSSISLLIRNSRKWHTTVDNLIALQKKINKKHTFNIDLLRNRIQIGSLAPCFSLWIPKMIIPEIQLIIPRVFPIFPRVLSIIPQVFPLFPRVFPLFPEFTIPDKAPDSTGACI